MFKTKTIAFITGAVFALSAASASASDAPWTASGTGATATSNGTVGNPVLDYSVAGSSGSWTFSATAGTARQQTVGYRYKGYHAWFQVKVKIERFVVRGGKEIATETLAAAGPVNCCVAPSGGFDYTGKTTFDLQAGDVYGFRMSGGHFDRDRRLLGTLTLTPQPAAGSVEDLMIKTITDRVNARNALIKQLTADIQAANAAGDTARAQELMVRQQQLIAANNNDMELLTNLVAKYGKSLDQILGNLR